MDHYHGDRGQRTMIDTSRQLCNVNDEDSVQRAQNAAELLRGADLPARRRGALRPQIGAQRQRDRAPLATPGSCGPRSACEIAKCPASAVTTEPMMNPARLTCSISLRESVGSPAQQRHGGDGPGGYIVTIKRSVELVDRYTNAVHDVAHDGDHDIGVRAPNGTARLPALIATRRPARMLISSPKGFVMDLRPFRQGHLDGIARAAVQLGLCQLMIADALNPDGRRHRLRRVERRRYLVHTACADTFRADGVLAVDGIRPSALRRRIRQHVGQADSAPGRVVDVGGGTEIAPLVTSGWRTGCRRTPRSRHRYQTPPA